MAWTTEDRCILKLLFEPEEAKSILADAKAGIMPPRCAPNWELLANKAQQEGVSALLFHNIKRHGFGYLIPRDSRTDFSNHYYANLKRNMELLGRLREVLASFEKARIPCIVLKGIALAEHVYPNIATRAMSDVDILVRKDDLFKADKYLSSLGYASQDSSVAQAIHNPVGYLASLEYMKTEPNPTNLNLHLHWHPVNTSVPAAVFAERIDISRLWEHATATSVAESPVLMLRPEHLIIYLCEHAMRVGHSFDRLILICDIFFTIKAFEKTIDWNFLAEESRRFNLSRFVYHGLSIVKQYTALGIADECIARLRPSDISLGERLFLKLQFDNRRIRGSSYFVYLPMHRGPMAKLRFIARTLFPPRPILLQRRYGKNTDSITWYYLARMREVFSSALGFTIPDRLKRTR